MRQKKISTIEELLKEEVEFTTERDKYAQKYQKSLEEARAREGGFKKNSKYSLRTKILKHEWLGHRPASRALNWLYKTVFKNPDKYRYTKRLMYQGGLFIFEYKNPKYKDTSVLPWFDQYPLVLSLGPITTNLGNRNMGFNLHLLPPRIRIIVLCYIFEIYKNAYRYGVFLKRDIYPVPVSYHTIVDQLKMYGVEFSIRMYIPARQKQIVHFPLKEWQNAIFIPSRGYYDIRAKKLIKEWKEFCRARKIAVSDKINWKNII
jgi:hypothetical protein